MDKKLTIEDQRSRICLEDAKARLASAQYRERAGTLPMTSDCDDLDEDLRGPDPVVLLLSFGFGLLIGAAATLLCIWVVS